MSTTAPHYLLFSETHSAPSSQAGSWSFVLERVDKTGRIEVADQEPDVRGERLKLLAAVRGLEAIEQPSKVTFITPDRFIGRAIRNGLSAWKENDWQWERFGVMAEVKNADLWKRIDRATEIHQIDCRVWNFGKYLQRSSGLSRRASSDAIGNQRNTQKNGLQLPSWTQLAASVANRMLPLTQKQAYHCA